MDTYSVLKLIYSYLLFKSVSELILKSRNDKWTDQKRI